jgi:hypothetical protein
MSVRRRIGTAESEVNPGRSREERIKVRAPTAQVRRVLQITGIDNLIEEQAPR